MKDLTDLPARIEARWPGRIARVLAETSSTNDVLKAEARAGADAGLVIVADSQTAGRGRAGHLWHSPPGTGLYLSTLIDAPSDARMLHIPLVCALSIMTGLSMLARGLSIKWPNDVIVADGRKLAGVLCEGVGTVGQTARVIVGVGVNVAVTAFPAEIEGRAVSLHTISDPVVTDRSIVAMALLDALDAWRRAYEEMGFQAVRKAFVRLTSTIGRQVECEGVRGEAVGITFDGALEIRREDGQVVPIHAGDVMTLNS